MTNKNGNAQSFRSLVSDAKRNCANYCDGCLINEGRNCLLEDGRPCSYYRDAVFPNRDTNYKYANDLHKNRTLIREYNQLYMTSRVENSRYCGCGELLVKGMRMCDKCRIKNRKNRNRKYYTDLKSKK